MKAAIAEKQKWLTIAELCEELGIAERTFRNGRSTGRSPWADLRVHKFGSAVRIRRSDFEEWLEICVDEP